MLNYLKVLWSKEYATMATYYSSVVKTAQDMNRQGYKETVIKDKVQELKKGFYELKNEAKEKVLNEINRQLERIEVGKVDTRKKYPDPTAEMLHRQDFDAKLKLMDKEDIREWLESEKVFSEYELNRMQYHARGAHSLLFAQKRQLLEKPYLSDEKYNNLVTLRENIKMIYNTPLIYFPSADGDGYSHITISFTLIDVLNTQVESIQQAVNSLNGLRYTDGSTEEKALLRYAEEERAKQYRYSEFDERIFRGGKKYDPTVLFKWLEERFDDDSGYFDPYSDDYDVMEHFEYLKSELAKKLEADKEWAEAYYKAESQAGSKS